MLDEFIRKEDLVPWSAPTHDEAVERFVLGVLPRTGGIVLDLGAGAGKYGKMFLGHAHVDAVEAFEPYVERFSLRTIYRTVFVQDVRDFVPRVAGAEYHVAILGDVLEHLPVPDSQRLVGELLEKRLRLVVVVPFLYPQGVVEANALEVHQQPDLTLEVMCARFPALRLIEGTPTSGFYTG